MKRIIIVGPAASGKDFLKSRLEKRGYTLDISYTTRPIRKDEEQGREYHFLTEKEFMDESTQFYEYVKFGDYYYGTGEIEWETCDVFIMEASAVKALTEKERKKCLVIYLNPPKDVRFERLWTNGRGWEHVKITKRFETDDKLFKDFTDYDIQITNPDF